MNYGRGVNSKELPLYTTKQIMKLYLDTYTTQLPANVIKLLLAAGKLALSARLVTMTNVKNISQRIDKMESDLNDYDNEIMAVSNVC